MPVAFLVPGSDAFPRNMFHARRAAIGGTLACHWLAWTDTIDGLREIDFEHGARSADPRVFVGSLAGALRTTVVLGSGSQSPEDVATAIVDALDSDGVTATAESTADPLFWLVTVANATGLVVPPAVDMTNTSLRGMHGIQRADFGDGAAGQTLNQDGGTAAIVWMNLGTLTAAGRVSGAYGWCNTGAAQCVMRLVVGTGPAYSLTPGAITIIGQGEATSDPVTGFASVAFEAVAVGASTQLWVGHATDTATAGLRYRSQSATPLGAGDVPAAQNILVDRTRNASSTNAFGATETPTVDDDYPINSSLGIIFEIPNGSGNYPADGSLTARIGAQSNDPNYGTQFDVDPAIIDGESTHHRQDVLPWTGVEAVSVTRVIGDTAIGEDSRSVLYAWVDLNRPSTTAATRVADLGPMGFAAGTGNRAVTLTLSVPVPVGSDAIALPYWSLGFNYCTASGAALTTMVLPVFLDDVPGDSGWLDAWAGGPRATDLWHDDIRGASEYAQPAGVTEYRTRVAAGNNGMPTTAIADPWPATFQTDGSDDSPSAIALDWVIVERAGFSAVDVSTYPIAGDVVFECAWSMASSAVHPVAGAVTVDAAWSMTSAAVHPIAGDVTVDAAWSMTSAAVHPIAGDVVVECAWSMTSTAIPDLDDIVGGAGSTLELQVLGVDQYGSLPLRAADPRPVRFELLDVEGAAVDPDIIESLTVTVRRASAPASTTTSITPTAETETGSDGEVYTWAVDLSEAVTVGGRWILEVDAVLIDGRAATWPSAGPLRIRASEGVD